MNSSNEPSEALVGSGVSRLLEESAQFDFVFTQCELEEVLANPGTLPPSFEGADGLLRDSLQPSALQFMPHTAEPVDLLNPAIPSALPVIPATTLAPHMYYGSSPQQLDAPQPGWSPDKPRRETRGARRSTDKPTTKAGPTVVLGPDGKPQISHSVVEKQRRDRINNLIDELREIVPPQESSGGDGKRPKHVVLADTIALVRDMQDKVCACLSMVDGRRFFGAGNHIHHRCVCTRMTRQRGLSRGQPLPALWAHQPVRPLPSMHTHGAPTTRLPV